MVLRWIDRHPQAVASAVLRKVGLDLLDVVSSSTGGTRYR